MSLAIRQTSSYTGDGHWNWSVWIDGPDAELDQVRSVEWVLHPTFPKPIVTRTQRQSKFRLDASGWGDFEVNAQVMTKDGRQQHLKHRLRLAGPGDAAEPSSEGKPVVFISAGVADAVWEDEVRAALARRGFDVLTANDVPAGVPVEAAISSTLDKADTIVGIFSDKSGPWAEREITKAMEKGVAVVPLVVDSRAQVPASLQHVQAIRITGLDEVEAAVGQIEEGLA